MSASDVRCSSPCAAAWISGSRLIFGVGRCGGTRRGVRIEGEKWTLVLRKILGPLRRTRRVLGRPARGGCTPRCRRWRTVAVGVLVVVVLAVCVWITRDVSYHGQHEPQGGPGGRRSRSSRCGSRRSRHRLRSRTWSPSGFVSAALRKRLSGDLDGLGRPGSPRGRWIPPFGGSVLHVRTLDCLLY